MRKETKSYSDIRAELNTGDLIVFGENGDSAELLKWISRYPATSIGIVLRIDEGLLIGNSGEPNDHYQQSFVNMVIETSKYNLVQYARLSTRISETNGEVWHLPLHRGVRNCLSGKNINIPKLINSFELRNLSGKMKTIEASISNLSKKDETMGALLERFHGSTLFTFWLDQAGLLGEKVSVENANNADVCKMAIFSETYSQLKGDPSIELPDCGSKEESVRLSNV